MFRLTPLPPPFIVTFNWGKCCTSYFSQLWSVMLCTSCLPQVPEVDGIEHTHCMATGGISCFCTSLSLHGYCCLCTLAAWLFLLWTLAAWLFLLWTHCMAISVVDSHCMAIAVVDSAISVVDSLAAYGYRLLCNLSLTFINVFAYNMSTMHEQTLMGWAS